MVKKRRVKCLNCAYSWGTKSKMMYVTCPRCLRKVKMFRKENKK